MAEARTVLIVDDNQINRSILYKMLSNEYKIVQAENGREALAILDNTEVSAVLLDIIMPVMDGFSFLDCVMETSEFSNIPIIVTTGSSDEENELKALSHGAWDFVSKPYTASVLKYRLKNAIERSQMAMLERLKYLAEYDVLTGIYNKTKFFDVTHKLLIKNPDKKFAFVHFDIDRFQLINSFFGMEEGNRLLQYIACELQKLAKKYSFSAYGRIEADVFCACIEYTHLARRVLNESKDILSLYNLNYTLVPTFGIYVVEDHHMPVDTIFDRAALAAKQCKGSYVNYCCMYTNELSQKLIREQEITNEMNNALLTEQFVVYFQPKYNLKTNLPDGAEALVRWLHPQKGLIYPGEFIPVFERNGFIRNLDYYVWESTCKQLKKWIDEGKNPKPISVNISRVDLYNPQIANIIIDLVQKYEISPKLLGLELTESAYIDNPNMMKNIMKRLQEYGFTMMMDDFGSGYSSLNILKDLSVDVLKIDMQFLSSNDASGRSESIIASVIHMAKCLNIPVIMEGVETKNHVDFLKSIDCDFVQGFYFAKPMPIKNYENLIWGEN